MKNIFIIVVMFLGIIMADAQPKFPVKTDTQILSEVIIQKNLTSDSIIVVHDLNVMYNGSKVAYYKVDDIHNDIIIVTEDMSQTRYSHIGSHNKRIVINSILYHYGMVENNKDYYYYAVK